MILDLSIFSGFIQEEEVSTYGFVTSMSEKWPTLLEKLLWVI